MLPPAHRLLLGLCLAALLGLFCALPGRAAQEPPLAPTKEAAQFSFDGYGLEHGLPGTIVTAATQTRDGYLWVGTPSGLGRCDGVRFTSYASSETPGLPNDIIYCFHEDRRGVLWVGTDQGLVSVSGGKFVPVGAERMSVRTLAADAAGNLWIGTWGAGVHVLRQDAPAPARVDALPANLRVRALFVDSQGQLWLATDRTRGVLRLDPDGKVEPFDASAALGEVLTIAESPRGTLWFGTKRDGVFRLKEGQLVPFGTAAGTGNTPVYEIRPARDGGLWVAAGTLLHTASTEQPEFAPIPGLPNRNIQSVCEDREGGLWLCAGSEGLTRMRALPYRLFSTHQGLPTDNIKNVTEDPSGEWWLAAQGAGLVRVDRAGTPMLQRASVGLPDRETAVVYAAREGSVWAAVSSHLWVRREGVWRQESNLRFVRGLYQDRAGTMWIGTESEGLFRHDRGQYTEVKTASGEHIPLATSFAEAGDGTLIVGTWRTGLWRISAGASVAEAVTPPPPTLEVRALHVDPEGRMWVGLNNRGLVVWERDRWLNPTPLVKALGISVSAIVEDESQRVWLGTLAGVMWAQKQELLAWMRTPISSPPIHAVPVGDETGIMPVWSGAQPVSWRAANGDLLFATRRGVLAIDPRRVVLNSVPPPVHIERVFVDRHAVDPDAPVPLPPGTRSLAIEYTALSFVQPERVLFRHKLEGYDADWVDAANRRSAFYGSLPPGDYVFRVRACNSDGVWSQTDAAIAIVQQPHFYQTRWFAWLLAAAAAASLWGLYRWSHRRLRLRLERLEREQAMEKERRRIAQDLHDDLGASLTEIGLFADATRRTAAPADRPGLDHLAQRVRTLVTSLDAIVWAVNPANDSLDQLVAYVSELFQELFRSSAIRCRMEVSSPIPRLPLTAEERSDIFLTAKEVMNNLLKHSGASEAFLRVRMQGNELRITVGDNGRGFDPDAAAASGGNGLANMRTRIARAHGTLEVRTAPGQGTEITIVVPFAGRKELPEAS